MLEGGDAAARTAPVPDGARGPAAAPSSEAETGPCSGAGSMPAAACHRQETH